MKKLYTSPIASEDERGYEVTLYELTEEEWYYFTNFSEHDFEEYFGLYSEDGCVIPGAIYHTYEFHIVSLHHLIIVHRLALNI